MINRSRESVMNLSLMQPKQFRVKARRKSQRRRVKFLLCALSYSLRLLHQSRNSSLGPKQFSKLDCSSRHHHRSSTNANLFNFPLLAFNFQADAAGSINEIALLDQEFVN